jgi:hypothetical protein
MTLNIKNTARDWRSFLVELAAEAARDADSTPAEYALHDVLHDLSLVAAAYSERLDVLRGEEGAAENEDELKQLVPEGTVQLVTDVPLAAATAGPVSPSELPDWLLETLRSMGNEIESLRSRVAALEDNAQKQTITPAPQYALDEVGIFDEDRMAWNSVGRARSALRGMIGREHQQRARIRQAILARVTSLAMRQELDADERAELAQHRDRADELATIDAIAASKIGEVEGIDDLLVLREYDTRAGWPQ